MRARACACLQQFLLVGKWFCNARLSPWHSLSPSMVTCSRHDWRLCCEPSRYNNPYIKQHGLASRLTCLVCMRGEYAGPPQPVWWLLRPGPDCWQAGGCCGASTSTAGQRHLHTHMMSDTFACTSRPHLLLTHHVHLPCCVGTSSCT